MLNEWWIFGINFKPTWVAAALFYSKYLSPRNISHFNKTTLLKIQTIQKYKKQQIYPLAFLLPTVNILVHILLDFLVICKHGSISFFLMAVIHLINLFLCGRVCISVVSKPCGSEYPLYLIFFSPPSVWFLEVELLN